MSAPAVEAAPATARRTPPDAVLLPLVGVLATMAVSLGAWRPSLWTDEAATISAARRTPAQLWRMLQELDAVHGLYYAALHVWTDLAGTSPFALRLPSAVAVGLAAVGVLVLTRRLAGGTSTAVLAAAAFTLLPRTAWSGTEARSTAAATALAVWCTVLLVRALATPPGPPGPPARRWWAGYALTAASAVVLNVYLVLLLAAHAVTVALLREVPVRRRVPWAVAAGAGLLLASPVVVLVRGQGGQLGGSSPGPVTLARRLVVDQFFLGETPTTGSGAGGWSWWQPAAVALAVLGWALVLPALRRDATGRRPAVAVWCLPWLLLPSGLVALAALLAPATAGPLHNPRYFAFCAPALAVLTACTLATLPRRPRLLLAGLAALLALPVLVSQRTPHAKSSSDWAQVADHLCRHASPGDAVYFGARRPPVDGTVTLTTRNISVAYPRCFAGLDDLTLTRTPAAAGDLTGRSRPLAAADLAAHDTVWVVRRPGDATVAADDEVLARAGFTERSRWSGPLDEVVEFTAGARGR
ncbi:hypothetical protein AB2L27_04915 [Kineococcus sp. LSe6-4]|uniref:Glycosyltransferase RgtA/B/C/D-like domain-containing protein n=1 Tax=Kineococcus halophytocola TaxID=3234027 RepID=A0ABV4GXS8_9ACTN